jgi:photosystem II stability/assembly factor-like uncharacterized protein
MKQTFYRSLSAVALILLLATTGVTIINSLKSLHDCNSKNVATSTILKNHPMLSRVNAPGGPGMLPSDWMDRQRSYPHGQIKTKWYLQAVRSARDMHASSVNRSDVNWQFAGPLNIGGRITDIEVPSGSFSTIYIAAASGGIFRTINNGADWENIFEDAATISVGDIAIDPSNADIIWAGTGESNASSQSFRGDGIYKSTDGGNTWQHSGLDESAYFGRIIVDHSNSNRVFAAVCGNLFTPDANRGIYRTINGGSTWERVLFVNDSVSGIDIVQHPTNPDILYAAMWERMRGLNYRRSFGPGSGIWKSEDGGDSWLPLQNGLPIDNTIGRIGLAIAPSSPSIIYAFFDNQYEVAVYKTQNDGQSWTRTNDGAIQGMNSSFGWYFGQIRVHPTNPNMAWVLGVDLFITTNGGSSWTQQAGYYNIDEIHVDHHAMHIHPLTGRILEGNDGGLYSSEDNGFSWSKINNLPLTQFYDIEADWLRPERIYGGTQDNNTVRTLTGNLNDWDAILGGDGFYSLVDYTNSNIIYAEYQWGGLNKSTNGGSYMYSINGYWSSDRVNWSAPVIMHPQVPTTLYFGTYRVWKSTNGGSSWTPVSGDLTDGDDGSTFHTITTLAISPIDPDKVLAGTDDGRVHISINGGTIWSDISAGLPDRWITRVATDPFDVNTIYVTCSGFRWDEPLAHVFRSTNNGTTWESISGNLPELPVNAFIADPTKQGRHFVATDAGIFWSPNAGTEWHSLNGTLGNVPVTSMKIHAGENFLLIGTYGLGAYKLDLAELSVGTNEIDPANTILAITTAWPQPFNNTRNQIMQFNIESPEASSAIAIITGLDGRNVFTDELNLLSGLNTLSWNGTSTNSNRLKPGIYILSLKTQGKVANYKFIVVN